MALDLERVFNGQVLAVPRRFMSLLLPNGTKVKELDVESDEITDPHVTLVDLRRKAALMEEMADQVEQRPIGRTRLLVRSWYGLQVTDGGIDGLENLHRAITETRKTDKRLLLTPAHLSDGDHIAAINLLAKNRRGLGIENDLVWMAGFNMLRRPSIRRFMRSEHVIYNATPRDAGHLQTLLDPSKDFGFSDKELEALETTRQVFIKIGEESKRRVNQTCIQGRRPLVVYVEGGRSYDGMLKKPSPNFSRFFPRDGSAIVAPYRVYGARELNPPGENPKVLRKELVMPWLRQPLSMVIGEYYPSSEIWDVWKKRREEAKEGMEINPMDWVMANIANLDSRSVRAEDLSFYAGLMQRFAPERNRLGIPSEII